MNTEIVETEKIAETAKVVFTPSGRRGTFPIGMPLLTAARQLGVDIDSVCGGRGLCGRCQILCTQGDFPKHGFTSGPAHLSPLSATETAYSKHNQRSKTNKPLAPGRRLSCQTTIQGNLLIDVPPESQMHRQVIRKEADQREISLDPVIHLYFVEVQAANMHAAKSDLIRLLEALHKQWQLTDLTWNLALLHQLQPALKEGKWSVTVAVHQHKEIMAIWPGFKDGVYGLAIDIGSTTIAAHLCELNSGEIIGSGGMMNPQIRFGEDLMSRVSYVMMQPEGSDEMTMAVRQGINELIAQISHEATIAPKDIVSISFVCNPIMHHLLLGISPVELGGAPFALAIDSAIYTNAKELGLHINPGASVYILPCIAGHVGADTAGVILSEQPHQHDEITLLIDIGTNAEIVLGHKQRLLACSSPTGPAFEGAQVSCGQRAAPGAIERVRIDPENLKVKIKVIGSEFWSDDPKFADSIASTGVTGICGSGIIEAIAEMYLAGILSSSGVIDGALASKTDGIFADGRTFSFVIYKSQNIISVSQTDVRQIQLAKSALYAGIRLLMDKLGINAIDRIRLAGAFGSHIDVKYAMVLGLFPDCPLSEVISVGNAAGTGARIALLNKQARHEIETVVRNIEKIETAIETKFQEYFINAMSIPHKTEAFPHLFSVVNKPKGGQSSPDQKGAASTTPRRRKRLRKSQAPMER